MKKLTYYVSTVALALTPFIAFAIDADGDGVDDATGAAVDAGSGVLSSIQLNVIEPLDSIVTLIIPIVIGLLIIAFFWGMAKYVFAQGDESSKAEGKKIMLYGAIAMFIAFSIWGIIAALQTTFGLTPGTNNTVTNIVPTF